MSKGWQAENTSPRKGKGIETEEDPDSWSNKLVLSARRSLMDRLRYDGIGKPLGLGHTVVRGIRTRTCIIFIAHY